MTILIIHTKKRVLNARYHNSFKKEIYYPQSLTVTFLSHVNLEYLENLTNSSNSSNRNQMSNLSTLNSCSPLLAVEIAVLMK